MKAPVYLFFCITLVLAATPNLGVTYTAVFRGCAARDRFAATFYHQVIFFGNDALPQQNHDGTCTITFASYLPSITTTDAYSDVEDEVQEFLDRTGEKEFVVSVAVTVLHTQQRVLQEQQNGTNGTNTNGTNTTTRPPVIPPLYGRLTFSGTRWATLLLNLTAVMALKSSLSSTLRSLIGFRVDILSMSIGSLIVVYEIHGAVRTTALLSAIDSLGAPGSAANILILAAAKEQYIAATGPTSEVFTVQSQTFVVLPTASPSGSGAACGPGCAGGIAGGLFVLVVILVLVAMFIWYRSRQGDAQKTLVSSEGGSVQPGVEMQYK